MPLLAPATITSLTAALLVAGTTAAVAQQPLSIARQGSIEAGGEIVHCATTDGGSLTPDAAGAREGQDQ